MTIPKAAVDHYNKMDKLSARAHRQAQRAWRSVDSAHIRESWGEAIPELAATITAGQVKAAELGASYSADTLAQQGLYEAPEAFVNPKALGGRSSRGAPLENALQSVSATSLNMIAGGATVAGAMASGEVMATRLSRTLVSDAGRTAAGMDTFVRPDIKYTRMINPGACDRCAVLAGRIYRNNEGFLRHPNCACIHVATSTEAAKAEGLITDQYEYFNGLPEGEQDRIFTKSGAQAIRDGADMNQVVNARRGMKPGGLMTTEGTTRRGNFGSSEVARQTGGRRMTPEAIYRLNGADRAAALRDLERYGYILPGGQNPLGSIVGQRTGYGQLGHGGAYPAARRRVEEAIAVGRDPAVRATMTAAERRLFDAKARWELVQQGVNPFNAPSMTSRAAVTGKPLTPQIAAQVEKDYRRWAATGGEIFIQ